MILFYKLTRFDQKFSHTIIHEGQGYEIYFIFDRRTQPKSDLPCEYPLLVQQFLSLFFLSFLFKLFL